MSDYCSTLSFFQENQGKHDWLIEKMNKMKIFKGQPKVTIYIYFKNVSFRILNSFTVSEYYTIQGNQYKVCYIQDFP